MFFKISVCFLFSCGVLIVAQTPTARTTTSRTTSSPNFPTLPTEPSITLNGSGIVDQVMENVRSQIKARGLDRIRLKDVNFTVNRNGSVDTVALWNGTIVGLGNVYRVGDVLMTANIREAKIRSAFAVYNASSDQDVAIINKKVNYTHGHVHMDVDNVTVYTVYKFVYATQTLTLDEFELSVGNFNFNITGLGDRAGNDSATITRIVAETKGPFLAIFNVVFKALVNAALQAVKSALLSAG